MRYPTLHAAAMVVIFDTMAKPGTFVETLALCERMVAACVAAHGPAMVGECEAFMAALPDAATRATYVRGLDDGDLPDMPANVDAVLGELFDALHTN